MKNLFVLLTCIVLLSISCTEKPEVKFSEENTAYDLAFEFRDKEQNDSAFYYFNQAKNIFLLQKDSLHVGKCLTNMGIILCNSTDYFGGLETSLEAIQFYKIQDTSQHHYIASNFNNLGVASYFLKDPKRATDFYNLALAYVTDAKERNVYLNNKAYFLQDQKEYKEAISIFHEIEKLPQLNSLELARITNNIAIAKWKDNKQFNPLPNLWKAKNMRQTDQDERGLVSSYKSISDYYIDKRTDSSLFYALRMREMSHQLGDLNDELIAISRIIELAKPDSAKKYFPIYEALSDSIQYKKKIAKNQFAMIRYEVEKNKTDNLRLIHENQEKNDRIARHRIILVAVCTLILLLIIAGYIWSVKRKQRLELQAQNQIKANLLKTSRKVHDVVANGIYRVMAEIENNDSIDREELLDQLEVMYEKSRDISYDTPLHKEAELKYPEKISQLLKSFATAQRQLIIVGNDELTWEAVNKQIRHEVEHILQELMVNMSKHSLANEVIVRFESTTKELLLSYADNGVGMPENKKNGNGLQNTGNRIKSLSGDITFVSEQGKGLKIKITIPLFN